MYLTSGGCAIRSRPLETLPITSAPSSADQALPRRLNRQVPSMTAAAMASSGNVLPPVCAEAAVGRGDGHDAAGSRGPAVAKTTTRISQVAMPARPAASALPPTAYARSARTACAWSASRRERSAPGRWSFPARDGHGGAKVLPGSGADSRLSSERQVRRALPSADSAWNMVACTRLGPGATGFVAAGIRLIRGTADWLG
jgi:hypothetical protein